MCFEIANLNKPLKYKIIMKNLSYLLLIIFAFGAISCTSDDNSANIDYDTYPVVYDVKNENFTLNNGIYQISKTFNNPMYETDMLLVYMQTGSTSNNSPIWQQIPVTLYVNNGDEVDYNYDFSRYDFVIYAGGTFDLGGTSYINNKTFRVLLVPASYGKSTTLDLSNYESVISHFQIDDSKPDVL